MQRSLTYNLVFPSTTTFLGALLALTIVPICQLHGDLSKDDRFIRLTIITVALAAAQSISSASSRLPQLQQAPNSNFTYAFCLLGLALHALFNQATRAFFDFLGLCLALLTTGGFLTQGLPNESHPDRRAALLSLIGHIGMGLLCALILVQLQAIFLRQQILDSSKDDSRENAVPDTDRSARPSARWSARRTVILLLVVQIIFSSILVLSTEFLHFGSLQLSKATLRATCKAAVTILVVLALQFTDYLITAISVVSLLLMGHYISTEFVIGDIGLVFFCAISYSRLKSLTTHLRKVYLACIILLALSQWLQHKKVYFAQHPMQLLMKDAHQSVEAFEAHESTIVNLRDAIADYKSRYRRLPPPGFDHWFNYSLQHDAAIISNFDQIDRDLRPFWNLEPQEIRGRTYTAIRDRNNYISPLRIRNGAVSAPPMLIPTHYWMLEGLMSMMADFVHYLPDMDIAINLNDEPRVLARTKSVASSTSSRARTNFTLSSEHWLEDIPFKEERPESFTKVERELRNTFDLTTRFCTTNQAVETSSPAKSLITHFLRNWRESLNICKGSHLKHSRGFFISPATLDVTDELLPVFSQSKPSTFNDILLPSPWNFRDKVGPDTDDRIPWSEKSDRVYWRGTTTEGWATWGSWRSMLRQRMVDILRGARSFALNMPNARLLLGSDATGYLITERSIPELAQAFDPDVFFVEIVRSDDDDKNDQLDHFELQPPNEFKEHWKHRYLLDADGAAFSGRFLPFLESRSLPLKFTSVFTEWWSDRVFAYQHFVPVTLESIYDVLTYFLGLPASEDASKSEAHPKEAQAIAKQGEAWAKRALRKDDMKIYLFRLLLEYGRLVDDQRDELGLVLP